MVGLDDVSVTSENGLRAGGERAAYADDLALLLEMAAAYNDARFAADGELVGDPTETALARRGEAAGARSPAAQARRRRCRSTRSASA